MAFSDFIFTGWKKEQKVFNKNLSRLKNKPEKEAVHDLRVSIKKLRAALELYYLLSGKTIQDDHLPETDKLFSILGKQRDLEICLELIDASEKVTPVKYTEPKTYFRSLLRVAYQWTTNAVQEYKKKEQELITRLLKTETQVIEQAALKIKIAEIIQTHLAACRELYKKPHKLRQRLKEIYYWIKMIPGSLLATVEYERDLHDLLEDFGNWQNLAVFEIKLRHFRKDFLPKTFPEYEAAKMLEADTKEKKENLLKVALYKTRKLLKII